MSIFPFIFAVDPSAVLLEAPKQVVFLSGLARKAVQKSAASLGVTLGELTKDHRNVPIPHEDHYWSLAHKPKYVCGVVSPEPVGIDVEAIRERGEGILDRVASEQEWQIFPKKNWEYFTRIWTAKESILKQTGIGIAGLRQCKLVDTQHRCNLLKCMFQGRVFWVQQKKHDQHIFAVSMSQKNDVIWQFFSNES